jgi:hypothetical protein
MTAIAAATIDQRHSAAQLMMMTAIAGAAFFRRHHCRQRHRVIVALVVTPLNLLLHLSPPSPIHYLIVVCHCQCLSPLVQILLVCCVPIKQPMCQQVTCQPNISGTPAGIFLGHVPDMLADMPATYRPNQHMSVVLTLALTCGHPTFPAKMAIATRVVVGMVKAIAAMA